LFHLSAPPQINEDASPTPVYSFVGNRKLVAVTCMFYGYPVPTVIMRDENGTEIARGKSTVSYTVSSTTEDDFGTFNCTAESPDGMAQYLVELRKAGICVKRFSVIWLRSRSKSGKIRAFFGNRPFYSCLLSDLAFG